ncbi:hypothetical protein Poli38472_002123 [Pythium oligandrum]|uniref:ubiquitinyl hydrolase 1 n=1 Tax=Pythium oligandrum TaxID=41045 RepID=A0A8K1FKU4_PYTOL|nr:hypothetical protein Poli38472_002123 [Pythium oligandrum]|eukprot:TMW63182.1 hypothetical protein Poli38472_002123 [Pythium oligandrum]
MPTVLDAVTPSDLKQAVAAQFPHLSDGSQQDAQEFLSSLLSCLSEELKRSPIHQEGMGDADLLSPSVFARFASFSRSSELTSSSKASQDVAVTINDSDGRPDTVVAKEWWIAHLLREPSIITALFCGQFKSVLRCSHCGNTSTRFEPFSSLQLPLVDETAMLSPRKKPQRTDVVVVLHFLGHQTPRRLVVTSGLDWTIEQLLIKLQETHATFSTAGHRQDHVAVQLNGACIDAVLDPDALLVTLPTPINVFELEYQTLASQTSTPTPFVVNERVLLQETPERWIRAVITRVDDSHVNCTPRSPVGSQSLPPLRYHVCLDENVHRRQVIVYGQELRPITDDRFLFLRFVHRHRGLVPFYATSPFRPMLVGVPFIHRIPASKATGKALYRAIYYRLSRYSEGSKWSQRAFVLRRVSCDGKCCDRCHWTTNCTGCPIDRSDESPLDLEIDETIAIDWAEVNSTGISSPGDNEDDWWVMMTEVEDDPSYTTYRESQTQGLAKSLKMLCAEEKLEARCSRCETQDTHSETAESTDQRQDTPRGFQIHTKSLTLWSLPAILVIQLKRFELVDDGGFSWQRLNHSIDFPINVLDLSPFLAASEASQDSGRDAAQVTKAEAFLKARLQFPTDTASRDSTSYRLYGIVHHMGDLGGGHYTAHVRHPESGDWWLVDDATVTPARVDQLSPSSSAYLLFYVRDDVDSCMEGTLLSPRHQIPTEWYPPQHGATRVSDHVIEQLWNQLKTPAMSSKPLGQPNENKCVMM